MGDITPGGILKRRAAEASVLGLLIGTPSGIGLYQIGQRLASVEKNQAVLIAERRAEEKEKDRRFGEVERRLDRLENRRLPKTWGMP